MSVEWEAGKDLVRREWDQHQELLPVGAIVHSGSEHANAASGGTEIRVCFQNPERAFSASQAAFLCCFSSTCIHGPAGPISLKTVRWTVFRVLDASKPSENRLEMQPDTLETAHPGL